MVACCLSNCPLVLMLSTTLIILSCLSSLFFLKRYLVMIQSTQSCGITLQALELKASLQALHRFLEMCRPCLFTNSVLLHDLILIICHQVAIYFLIQNQSLTLFYFLKLYLTEHITVILVIHLLQIFFSICTTESVIVLSK